MSPEAAVVEETQELTRARAVGASIGFGLSAANWHEGLLIAKQIALSDIVPKQYIGKPNDILIAMQLGAEVGLPPMAALQSIGVINGKPGAYGDGFLAVIMSKPAYVKHKEYYVTGDGEMVDGLSKKDYDNDDTRCVSIFWRRGNPEPFKAEFSIYDAKKAKLWTKEGPWTNYPQRMLLWRAREYAGRNGFAPELRGMRILENLVDDEPLIDIHARPLPPPTPIRRSEKNKVLTIDQARDQFGDPSVDDRTPAEIDAELAAAVAEPSFLQNELPTDRDVKPPRDAAKKKPTPASAKVTMAANAHKPDEPTRVEHLIITETAYITPKDGQPYTEVRGRVEAAGQAPIGYIFVTRDKDLAEVAASCEGTPQQFTVTFHLSKRPDNSICKVLDALEASE